MPKYIKQKFALQINVIEKVWRKGNPPALLVGM